MSIYPILESLKNTSSKKEKMEILNANKDNPTLARFFRLALNPYINFWFKRKLSLSSEAIAPEQITLDAAMDFLETKIATREITGNEAADAICVIALNLHPEDRICFEAILAKDPDCGVDTAAEKIWPGANPSYPCLLATEYKKEFLKYYDFSKGVYVQTKEDGLRVNIIIDENGGVTLYTRSGRVLNVHGVFDFMGEMFKNAMFDGELLSIDTATSKFLPRKISNGISSKAVRGTISVEEAQTLHAVLWDTVPLDAFKARECKTTYDERFALLRGLLGEPGSASNKYSIVNSKIAHSIEEVLEFYAEMRDLELEGCMLKSRDLPWSDTRSKLQLKFKQVATADLEVVGAHPGEGILTGNLGALIMATSDRKLKVSMSGFSLKLRSEIWANLTGEPVEYVTTSNNVSTVNIARPGDSTIKMGSILETKYNEKIIAEGSEEWSLFLPRFSAERLDKTTANTLEEIA